MPEPKPVLRQIKSYYNYRIDWGPYVIRVKLPRRSEAQGPLGGVNIPISVEISRSRTPLATFYGVRYDELVRIKSLDLTKDQPNETPIEKELAGETRDILMTALEIVLKDRGVGIMRGEAHASLAKSLKRMDYDLVPIGAGRFSIEKNLVKKKPRLPFRMSAHLRKLVATTSKNRPKRPSKPKTVKRRTRLR